jgi:8-oxo-dGTP pyrophosphatase MutT (NUDIX family)
MSESYCNNCGKHGHLFHHCKLPITSFGVIAFSFNDKGEPIYLMIRRKDTLGYIDFMRGKYSVQNKHYILNMFKQMTVQEKAKLRTQSFDVLWKEIWEGNPVLNQYKTEEIISREKFNNLSYGIMMKNEFYTLTSIIDESEQYDAWTEPEWGFPKGRRNYQEKDYICALREFEEETGHNLKCLKNVQNILPFEENFTGSNYKSYKHKYYLMFMKWSDTILPASYQRSEVSKMEWKTYEDSISCMRSYNLEKKRMITNVHNSILKYKFFVS